MSGWPHPRSPTRVGGVLAAMAAVLFVIARATGSGWLLVIFSGVVAVVILGLFLPALELARIRAGVEAPADGTAGRPVAVLLTLRGSRHPVTARLLEPRSEWVGADGATEGDVVIVPVRRGIVDHVDVEVRSGAPLGVSWWRRRLRVPLRRPLEVAPAPVPARLRQVRSGRDGERAPRAAPSAGSELVRGVRPYVPGDRFALVSWKATARHAAVMVKEMDAPPTARLVVVVDLPPDGENAELCASRAAGLALAGLEAGMAVMLCTAEATGPKSGLVRTPLEVGRRLARAVQGTPGRVPAAAGDVVVRADAG